jgi:hypothetical protein
VLVKGVGGFRAAASARHTVSSRLTKAAECLVITPPPGGPRGGGGGCHAPKLLINPSAQVRGWGRHPTQQTARLFDAESARDRQASHTTAPTHSVAQSGFAP